MRFLKRHRLDDPAEEAPARAFLESCPVGVRAKIFAVLAAVAEAPPPQFSGGGMWVAMHGSMSGFYEVRVMGPGRTLYRVFCLLERMNRRLGVENDSIVLIQGMAKRAGTAFSARDYARLRGLADEYRARVPRNLI